MSKLQVVDSVEILNLVDNCVDLLLPSNERAIRPQWIPQGMITNDTLIAEHGLSQLVTVHRGAEIHTVLFDTGYGSAALLHNLKYLGVNLSHVEAIVFSHGHMDHTGSVEALLTQINRSIKVVVHPDVFLYPRYLGLSNGSKGQFPPTLSKKIFKDARAELIESKDPTFLANDTILVSGQVKRTTSFEKGMPNALKEVQGELVHDPILDDQALIFNLDKHGLVILSGCAHAGIINTVLYARNITNQSQVSAVLGGFHLSGPMFEPIISDTIAGLKEFSPELIVPMHCTGWKAISIIAEKFPKAFILNSVGTKYVLKSDAAAVV